MLLPDPKRRGEIKFVLARSLPYDARIMVVGALLFLGVLLQAFVGLWLGAPLLLAATLLFIVRGYDNLPGRETGRKEWRGADISQLENILNIQRRARKWDQSLLDITCVRGLAAFAAVTAAAVFFSWILSERGEDLLSRALLLDAGLVLAPHWFTGVRRILTNAPLSVKIQELLFVHSIWKGDHAEDEDMTAQMEVRKAEKGEVPSDAKLILKLPPLGDSFLGVQVQAVLNNVQGKDFPYVYCVLVARPELGMLDKLDPDPPSNIIFEKKRQDDVDVAIVRQYTTKTSGYHTSRAAVAAIFRFARGEARKLMPS